MPPVLALHPGEPGRSGAAAPADSPLPVAVAWGLLWRYLVVGATLLVMFAGIRPPILAGAAVAVAGAALGLWYRRSWVAGLWRAILLAWLAGLASVTALYPYAVVAVLAVITVEPWLLSRRALSRR